MTGTLYLHNNLAREKQPFEPQDASRVTVYVCGPTVYGPCHIGNFRPAVVFDVMVRVLRALYPNVVYARNITDVDDKINAKAAEEGVDISVITARYHEKYLADMDVLSVLPPDVEPHATRHIDEMQAMIAGLIENGHAYAAEGHVLFDVTKDGDYGSLSGRSRDDMIAGARVEVAPYKKDTGDFVLWKPSSDDQPGWDSVWGRGRPGWHIECSAMIEKHLGTTIDIHGGGADLQFPHHENEAAQSRCAHGAPLARFWVHNGMLNISGEKMSKSLGNIKTMDE
ncbi:MAG: cysteine--tRNA ligase, partial [Parvibaculales bacterium]